jgi:hypothetical protein
MRRSVSGPVEGSITNTQQGEPGQTPGELRRCNTLQEAEAELEKALARVDRADQCGARCPDLSKVV